MGETTTNPIKTTTTKVTRLSIFFEISKEDHLKKFFKEKRIQNG